MAFPTVTSITSTALGAGPGPFNVPMPATVAAGDLLVMFYGSGYAETPATPTGWTAKWDTIFSTRKGSCFVKDAAGTEGGTNVSTGHSADEQGAAQVYRILAAEWDGDIANVVVGTTDTGTDEFPDPPSVTPSWGALDTLWIEAVSYKADFSSVTSYSTNYTNGSTIKSVASDTGNEQAVATARRELNATSENPGVITLSSTYIHIDNTLAIKPAAAAGGLKGNLSLLGVGQ